MNYTLFNLAQPIIRDANLGGQNFNYFSLLNVKYSIFGLSSFYISKLPADITVINYNLDMSGVNTVLLQTDNVNYMTGVKISVDQWNAVITSCAPTTTNMLNIRQKYLSTVPAIQNSQQNIYETSSALDFAYFAAGSIDSASPLSATVLYTNILYFENITPGMAHRISFSLTFDTPGLVAGASYQIQYSLSAEGNQLISRVVTIQAAVATAADNQNNIFSVGQTASNDLGFVFTSASPAIEVTINLPRAIEFGALVATGRTISSSLTVTQFSSAYDPITDCCVQFCPENSGVSLGINLNPPVCQACTAGLVYNSATRSCQCQTGFYTVTQALTNVTQCFPCFAQLCQSCNSTTRTTCNSCVSGAAFDNNTICNCITGFYRNAARCEACPIKCGSCSNANVCLNCSDTITRSINDSCNCIIGYFDAGSAVCSACPVLCRTCSSATTCLSCFTENQRTLSNGQCVCATGFYQVVNPDGSLTCSPCAPTCTSCSLLPTSCTNCDANANRILGYDNLGNQVCNCIPGYSANANGDCVQSNCVADPFCSTCLNILSQSTCIKCIAATFRVLVMP